MGDLSQILGHLIWDNLSDFFTIFESLKKKIIFMNLWAKFEQNSGERLKNFIFLKIKKNKKYMV